MRVIMKPHEGHVHTAVAVKWLITVAVKKQTAGEWCREKEITSYIYIYIYIST
jgi:hypothetical protein